MSSVGGGSSKERPLVDDRLGGLARRYGTPLFVYDTAIIRRRVAELRDFDVVRYAQKANNNLSLLGWMRELGLVVDAVSAGEARRALRAGFDDDQISYTADLFDRAALDLLAHHDLKVNLGSADMIEQYAGLRPGSAVTLRINPGFGHGHDRKVSTGGALSKHGIWHQELPLAVERARAAGIRATGVHIHIGSGSDLDHLSQVQDALTRGARVLGDSLERISAGGGLPIAYRPDEEPFGVRRYVERWLECKARLEDELGRRLTLEVEPGRYLVAESGMLLTEVRATKKSGGINYILVDAGFDNLLRPALYGSYHHISILGRDGAAMAPRLVAGPLCESADLFTQRPGGEAEPRELPAAEVGDLVCIHDVGAYAASMASNYNTRPHAAEVLVDGDEARLIRRRQSFDSLIEDEIELVAD